MNLRSLSSIVSAVAVAVFLSGCTDGDDGYRVPEVDEAHESPSDHGHDHHHHAHGPHGGEIVELGSEDLHAEAVVDEDGNVLDIYILGSDAETAVAIDAKALTLSFKHGEESEDFELVAAAQEGDEEGKASRFTITNEDVLTELHHHSEGATLMFEADSIAYMGTVVHHHDHDHHGDGHADHGDHGDGDGHHEHGDADGHGDAAHSTSSEDTGDGDADAGTETSDDAGTEDTPSADANEAPASAEAE